MPDPVSAGCALELFSLHSDRVVWSLSVHPGLTLLVTSSQVASHGTGFLQVKGKVAKGYGTHDHGLISIPFQLRDKRGWVSSLTEHHPPTMG